MREWFDNLAPRERYLLIVGALVVLVTGLWLFVWEPVATGRAQAAADVERKEQLLALARRTLGSGPAVAAAPTTTGACNQSLTLLVANTVRDAGLGGAYRSSSPFGNDGLRVSLENASFDQAVAWLGRLRSECGIEVESGSFTRRPEPGRVDASVTIERTPS